MSMRLLPLAAALLLLGGCATQQAAVEQPDAAGQRLSNIEGLASQAWHQGQATQKQIADLGKRLEAMSAEMTRLRETQARDQESVARRLNDLTAQAGDNAARAGELKHALTALKDRAEESDPPLAERLDRAEETLADLTALVDENAEVNADLQSALAGKAGTDVTDALSARLTKVEKRLEEVAAMAQDALDAMGLGQRRILGKVVDTIVLTDDKTLFPINSPELGNADMAKLDALAAKVKILGTHYHLQIQGHTDGFGSEDYNYDLGRARAEVVKNYLNEKGGIPILRMSVISYGAKEAASYTGKSNRRIVVNVLQ